MTLRILFVGLMPRSLLFRAPSFNPTYFTQAAALLRERGHEVAVVERGAIGKVAGLDPPRIRESFVDRAKRFSPDIVLFEGRSRALSDLRDLGEEMRRTVPESLILAGGMYATLLPEEALEEHAFLDGVLLGEPERSLLALAEGSPLMETGSCAYREKGTVRVNRAGEPFMDLDALPFPAWDLLDMDYYTRPTPRVIPCFMLSTVTLTASRGCSQNCTFCSEGRLNALPVRYHSGRYVAGMFAKLKRDYGTEGVYFTDEMLLGDHGRVAEICDELIKAGLSRTMRWTAQVRTDAVSPEILALMRRAGCVQLEFGVESGSQKMLDGLCKGTTVEGNAAALRMTRGEGIRTLAYIIYGLPGERIEDLRMTETFLKKEKPDIVRLMRCIPLPGTPMTKKLIAEGRLPPGFWKAQERRGDLYGGQPFNLSAMSDGVLSREAKRLYRRMSFRPYAADFIRQGCLKRFRDIFDPAQVVKFMGSRLVG